MKEQEVYKKAELKSNNGTGITGITRTLNKKFKVEIIFDNQNYYLGIFKTIEEAITAKKKKEDELFGS